ncbi:hypothetical protein BVX97_04765 [bacterium E08(2017)]|nr:hypothetical protein BVX97_04765 [bacterium E08(2017)]
MLALVVILLAVVQLNSLTLMETNTMTEARAEAAEAAMSDAPLSPTVPYLNSWEEGDDEMRYTPDDDPQGASAGAFYADIVNETVSDSSQWNIFTEHGNPIESMYNGGGVPSTYFGLVQGEASASTNLLPGFASIIGASESVDVETEVWMTWTRGIY